MPDEVSKFSHNSGASESTSVTLLDGLLRESQEAWDRIVQIWGPLIYERCRNKGFSPDESNDLMQNVFVHVYSGIGNFHRDGKGKRFRFWISKILHNEIVDYYRKQAKLPVSAGGTDFQQSLNSLPSADGDSDEWCQPALIVAQFLGVIQNDFDPRTWEAFQLVTFKNYSNREAGEKTGISADAVRQATFRIRQRLKSELSGIID